MSNLDLPPFVEALERYRAFLAGYGFRTDIRWLFREDAIHLRRRAFVKVPLSDENPVVEKLYAVGVRDGIGVNLSTFCLLDDSPCCYIWIPKDEEDASYRMLRGLKLSVQPRSDVLTAVSIRSGLRWKWLKSCERRSKNVNWAEDIPARSESIGVLAPTQGGRTVNCRLEATRYSR